MPADNDPPSPGLLYPTAAPAFRPSAAFGIRGAGSGEPGEAEPREGVAEQLRFLALGLASRAANRARPGEPAGAAAAGGEGASGGAASDLGLLRQYFELRRSFSALHEQP